MSLAFGTLGRHGARFLSVKAENPAKYAFDIDTVNPHVLKAEYAVRGAIVEKSLQMQAKMASGEKYPFDNIISCNIGNPFAVGKKALTFPRQLVAAVEYPALIDSGALPAEVCERARQFLAKSPGGTGSYSHSQGIESIRKHIAEFIKKRDGASANSNDIYLTTGASSGVTTVLQMLISHPRVGILTPFPTYPLYTADITLMNGVTVPYYLRESKRWGLDINDLSESYYEAKRNNVDVRALVVINPGNPTGSVMSSQEMSDIVEFCDTNNIVLIADEVYQDNVYNPSRPFISFKKVVTDTKSNVQLISLHSISKGFMGECGHRGGYMEIVNIPDAVKAQIYKMASIGLCPNTVGQVLVDVMVHPPESSECKQIWQEETKKEIGSLKDKAEQLCATLNSLPGISCQPADGSMYLFPSLNLPLKAFEAAKSVKIGGKVVAPDMFWCLKLLEEAGVLVVPGSGFGQVPGTNHFRITFLPVAEKMQDVLQRLTTFQNKFMEQYA